MRERVRRGLASSCFFLCGICILFAVLPFRLTAVFLLSAAAHECGHIAVMRLLGIPVKTMRLLCGGAVLRGDFSAAPYHAELLSAAAGPLVNGLLALLFFRADSVICVVNVLLALYNLLPLPANDGAVMLLSAAALCGRLDGMRRVLHVIGEGLWAVLLMFGAWVFWFGALSDADGVSVRYGALFFCVLARMPGRR